MGGDVDFAWKSGNSVILNKNVWQFLETVLAFSLSVWSPLILRFSLSYLGNIWCSYPYINQESFCKIPSVMSIKWIYSSWILYFSWRIHSSSAQWKNPKWVTYNPVVLNFPNHDFTSFLKDFILNENKWRLLIQCVIMSISRMRF